MTTTVLKHHATGQTKPGKVEELHQGSCGRWVWNSLIAERDSEVSCPRCAGKMNGQVTAASEIQRLKAKAKGRTEPKATGRHPLKLKGKVLQLNLMGERRVTASGRGGINGNYRGRVTSVQASRGGGLKSVSVQLRNGPEFDGRKVTKIAPNEIESVVTGSKKKPNLIPLAEWLSGAKVTRTGGIDLGSIPASKLPK